jgi:hypothetical protein
MVPNPVLIGRPVSYVYLDDVNPKRREHGTPGQPGVFVLPVKG